MNGAVSKTVVGSWSTESSNLSPSALASETPHHKRGFGFEEPVTENPLDAARNRLSRGGLSPNCHHGKLPFC